MGEDMLPTPIPDPPLRALLQSCSSLNDHQHPMLLWMHQHYKAIADFYLSYPMFSNPKAFSARDAIHHYFPRHVKGMHIFRIVHRQDTRHPNPP